MTDDSVKPELSRASTKAISRTFHSKILMTLIVTFVAVCLGRMALAAVQKSQLEAVLFGSLSAALIGFALHLRRTSSYKRLSFFSALALVATEAALSYAGITSFLQFFAVIPLTLVFVWLLAGPRFGIPMAVISVAFGVHIMLGRSTDEVFAPFGQNLLTLSRSYNQYLLISNLLIIFIILSFQGLVGKSREQIHRQKTETDNNIRRLILAENLGVLAHEINNPLAILDGSVRILKRIYPDQEPAQREKTLLTIATAQARLSRVLQTLMTFTGRDQEEEPFGRLKTADELTADLKNLIPHLPEKNQAARRSPQATKTDEKADAKASDSAARPKFGTIFKKRALAVVDLFLPAGIDDPAQRLRLRTFIILLLLTSFWISFTTPIGYISGFFNGTQLAGAYLAVLFQFSVLILTRRLGDQDWMPLLYLCAITLVMGYYIINIERSLLAPLINIFSLVLIFGFFILTNAHARIILSVVVIGAFSLVFILIKGVGTISPYGLSLDALRHQAAFLLITRTLLTSFCLHGYVRLKAEAEATIEKEYDLQVQNAKLVERITVIRSFYPELNYLLEQVAKDIQMVKENRAADVPAAFGRVEGSMERLKMISQTIAWTYKGYRGDLASPTTAARTRDHLRMIVRHRFVRSPWKIQCADSREDFGLEGRLPSVLLLVVSVVEHIIERESVDSGQSLDITLTQQDQKTLWMLEWKGDLNVPEDLVSKGTELYDVGHLNTGSLRRELIRDLLVLSECRIDQKISGQRCQLRIEA